MARKRKQKTSNSKVRIICTGPTIFEIANEIHHTVARHCEYCGKPMTPSDVNDYGSLCYHCYMKEYYGR